MAETVSVREWLDTVKAGWGACFAKTFEDYGIDDTSDLAQATPDDLRELEGELVAAGVKRFQLRLMLDSVSRLCAAQEEPTLLFHHLVEASNRASGYFDCPVPWSPVAMSPVHSSAVPSVVGSDACSERSSVLSSAVPEGTLPPARQKVGALIHSVERRSSSVLSSPVTSFTSKDSATPVRPMDSRPDQAATMGPFADEDAAKPERLVRKSSSFRDLGPGQPERLSRRGSTLKEQSGKLVAMPSQKLDASAKFDLCAETPHPPQPRPSATDPPHAAVASVLDVAIRS